MTANLTTTKTFYLMGGKLVMGGKLTARGHLQMVDWRSGNVNPLGTEVQLPSDFLPQYNGSGCSDKGLEARRLMVNSVGIGFH